MSTDQANDKTVENKQDEKVNEVTEKMDNLNVDNKREANDRPRRGGFRGRGGYRRGNGGSGRRFAPKLPYDEQVKKIEEEQKSKEVVEAGVKGVVKWFSVRGRYGFLARETPKEENEDFFVHQTAIAKSSTIKIYLRTLDDEEPVVFDIVKGRKGLEAANVTGPEGANVRGSRFQRQLVYRRHQQFRGPRQRNNTKNDGERVEKSDEQNQENKPQEEGEVRGKRRNPRRARGKFTPNTENDGDENKEAPKEKGDGDAAAAPNVQKKNRRRNHKKEASGKPTEQQPQAVEA